MKIMFQYGKNFKNFTVEIYLSLIYENFCQIMNFIYKELEKNKLIINIRQLIKLYDEEINQFFQRGYAMRKMSDI